MMFYTTVAGWMMSYVPKMASGALENVDAAGAAAAFDGLLADPVQMVCWMVVACTLAILVCSLGVQKGVERITKVLMMCLLAIIGVLVVRALTLPGAQEGVGFYLAPDFSKTFVRAPAAFCEAAYCRHGPGILHALHRHGLDGHLRQLHRARPLACSARP